MKKYEWSQIEIDFLLNNIDKIPLKLISEKLNKPYYFQTLIEKKDPILI